MPRPTALRQLNATIAYDELKYLHDYESLYVCLHTGHNISMNLNEREVANGSRIPLYAINVSFSTCSYIWLFPIFRLSTMSLGVLVNILLPFGRFGYNQAQTHLSTHRCDDCLIHIEYEHQQ